MEHSGGRIPIDDIRGARLMRSEGRKVVLVEYDNANPDVFRAHKDLVRAERADSTKSTVGFTS